MTDSFYHRIFLANRRDKAFLGSPTRFRAECLTCGWCGEWESSEDRAEADGEMHKAEGEPLEAA